MRYVRLLLVALVLMALPVLVTASGTSVEEVTVNADKSTPTYSDAELVSGTTYLLEASGTYTFGSGGRTADAEYYREPDWTEGTWEKTRGDWNNSGVLDLLVDPDPEDVVNPDWGGYSSDHTYTMCYEGQGRPVSFVISDWYHDTDKNYWHDNNGSLSVEIFELGCVAEWLPPITNADFELKDGSTLPIKFRLCSAGDFSNEIEVTVMGTDDNTDWFSKSFTPIYDAETDEYIVVFHTKDYELAVGNYTVVVSRGGCELDTFPFYLDVKANRGNRGK